MKSDTGTTWFFVEASLIVKQHIDSFLNQFDLTHKNESIFVTVNSNYEIEYFYNIFKKRDLRAFMTLFPNDKFLFVDLKNTHAPNSIIPITINKDTRVEKILALLHSQRQYFTIDMCNSDCQYLFKNKNIIEQSEYFIPICPFNEYCSKSVLSISSNGNISHCRYHLTPMYGSIITGTDYNSNVRHSIAIKEQSGLSCLMCDHYSRCRLHKYCQAHENNINYSNL